MSASPCIAYRADGTLCRAPVSILDPQRGGKVCSEHASARRDKWVYSPEDAPRLFPTVNLLPAEEEASPC